MDSAPEDGVRTRPSIGDLFGRLSEDAQALVRAEIALYRMEASRRALSASLALGLVLGALVLAQGALIALLVGLVVLIGRHIGLGWSILLVVGTTLLLAGGMAWLGIRRVEAMIEPGARP